MIAGGLIVALVFIVFILEKVKFRKAKFTHYPQFGINIPEGYSIHGIDVSKYQSPIAWEEVKAMRIRNINPGFAFIKATEGIGNSDPQFKQTGNDQKKPA
jgi:lysozyme